MARRGRVVAGQQDRREAELAQPRDGLRGGGLDGVADDDDAARPPVPADGDGGVALAVGPVDRGHERRRRGAAPSRRAGRGRPTTTAWPSTTPCDAEALAVGEVLDGAAAGRRAAAMARPIGCSDADSSAAARRRTSSTDSPSAATTSCTVIWPVVTVPVLSSTIVSTRRVDSSTSGPLIRMPSCAPRPVPTMQRGRRGQAEGARAGDDQHRDGGGEGGGRAGAGAEPEAERRHGRGRSRRARRRRRCGRPGAAPAALPFCASSTSRAICASWVSAPTRVARTTSLPPALTVAPTTASPGRTSTGTDSPVSMEASTAEVPSTTSPSVAIFSPGRTTNSSPTTSWSTGIRVSVAHQKRRRAARATSRAPSSSSARSAAPARRFERCSSQRPASRNVVTPAAASR